MKFQILYTKTASKDIQKLDRIVKSQIKKKIEIYIKNPLHYAKRLTDPRLGTYRWRIGNYRIVFDIDRENIIVLRIRHRRDVYK
ncbi:type II toxin-antitoxin system RelE/ParE family toxin [Candidatus Gottesmanbacteria bacterium]|nr:type II toxin-antitoxin system RelE/ParE family toxin [Candidatus Gottesmanbacteria bacterium]